MLKYNNDMKGSKILAAITGKKETVLGDELDCPMCGGEGYHERLAGGWTEPLYEEYPCPECNGTGFLLFMEVVEAGFDKGWDENTRFEALEYAIGYAKTMSLDYITDIANALDEVFAPEEIKLTDELKRAIRKHLTEQEIETLMSALRKTEGGRK